jgi:hypothetical protein
VPVDWAFFGEPLPETPTEESTTPMWRRIDDPRERREYVAVGWKGRLSKCKRCDRRTPWGAQCDCSERPPSVARFPLTDEELLEHRARQRERAAMQEALRRGGRALRGALDWEGQHLDRARALEQANVDRDRRAMRANDLRPPSAQREPRRAHPAVALATSLRDLRAGSPTQAWTPPH